MKMFELVILFSAFVLCTSAPCGNRQFIEYKWNGTEYILRCSHYIQNVQFKSRASEYPTTENDRNNLDYYWNGTNDMIRYIFRNTNEREEEARTVFPNAIQENYEKNDNKVQTLTPDDIGPYISTVLIRSLNGGLN